jgi:cytoskeletal protein CcmA (bactofilin family)
MFSKDSTAQVRTATAAPSIISSDVVITGILQSAGDIQIDGRIDGNVKSAGLVIGESAEIGGEIHAETLVVRGKVEGTIRARKVALAAGCHVQADILHKTLEVEFGAFVQGAFRHSPDPLADALPDEGETADRRRPGSPMRDGANETAPVEVAPLKVATG